MQVNQCFKLDLRHRAGHTVTILLNAVKRQHAGGVFHDLALFGTNDRDKYERELLNARKMAEALLLEKPLPKLRSSKPRPSSTWPTSRPSAGHCLPSRWSPLFIVREIAKAHGGDVSVSSSRLGGTTLEVRFAPCRQG